MLLEIYHLVLGARGGVVVKALRHRAPPILSGKFPIKYKIFFFLRVVAEAGSVFTSVSASVGANVDVRIDSDFACSYFELKSDF